MGRKEGGVPLSESGPGSPSNTMWPGPRPTSVPSGILIHPAVWPQQTWAEKWGALPLIGEGELGTHLTKSLGPRPTSIPSGILIYAAIWPQQTWANNWGGSPPFWGEELGPNPTQCGQAEAYLLTKFHLDPSNRLATIHQHYRQTGQTDRRDNGLIP